MSTEAAGADNVILFPSQAQLQVLPIEPLAPLPQESAFTLIEHDGRMYNLEYLVEHLSPEEIQEMTRRFARRNLGAVSSRMPPNS